MNETLGTLLLDAISVEAGQSSSWFSEHVLTVLRLEPLWHVGSRVLELLEKSRRDSEEVYASKSFNLSGLNAG